MSDDECELIVGDSVEALRMLDADSVQCCVTSPPYWGLRDYGVEGMIGLEGTWPEHLARLLEVFAEVRRVLRPDGTLWLNYGDCYAGSWGNQGRKAHGGQRESSGRSMQDFGGGTWVHDDSCDLGNDCLCNPTLKGGKYATGGNRTGAKTCEGIGLAPKQRMLLPHRLALALQDAGWWVRSEIVWHKPNPMPSPVTDRPTDAHEFVYLLTKSPRYFYDADAIREPATYEGDTRHLRRDLRRELQPDCVDNGARARTGNPTRGRNKRSVWTIPTQGYKGAHFATFPEALVEPCVLAGSAPGDLVLDPFSGSGTTGVVALKHGRRYVGIELNPEYADLQEARLTGAEAFVLWRGRIKVEGKTTTLDGEKTTKKALRAAMLADGVANRDATRILNHHAPSPGKTKDETK